MVSLEEELVYWRTLAIERGLALDDARARMRKAIATARDDEVAVLAAAWNGDLAGWMREPERMEPLSELRPTDVFTALDEIWNRLLADGGL